MALTREIAQQPQSQETMIEPQGTGVIVEQPKATEQMSSDSSLHMRGGGVVGDCFEAICAFEICKGCCDCCC